MSAQAAVANRALQDAVGSRPLLDRTGGMAFALALDTLSHTVGGQEHHETESMYPHARTLDVGCGLRDLPMPPVESALLCLRMAQGVHIACQPNQKNTLTKATENPRVKLFWLYELCFLANFTEYFLKAYSPGDATHADLIIVNTGLYWLFLECKNVTTDPDRRSQLQTHAGIFRDNVETILSILPFHLPMKTDTVFALTLAVRILTQHRKKLKPDNLQDIVLLRNLQTLRRMDLHHNGISDESDNGLPQCSRPRA